MITLITGIPGMGKTALLVSMLLELEKAAERPLFVMGIPDMQIEHIPCPPVEEWTEQRPDKDDPTLILDYFCFPPNAVLIIDEAQRVFRPRSSASKVPPYVAALETHRHTGLDIILLTQKPKLLDSNVRELVGRHIHIRNGFLGRWLYEWPHIADGENRLDRSEAVRRRFKPPKEAFAKYKSAEVHTKPQFRFNLIWLYLVGALSFFGYTGSQAYMTVMENMNPEPAAAEGGEGAALGRGDVAAAPPSQTIPAAPLPPGTGEDIFTVDPANSKQHPFDGYQFSMLGTVKHSGKTSALFKLRRGSETMTIKSPDLVVMGYDVQIAGPCFAFLHHGTIAIAATCEASQQPAMPAVTEPPFLETSS